MWRQIFELILQRKKFVLTTHTNPDCDALGSELALAETLKKLGKQVDILNSDAVPPAYRFLDKQPRGYIRRFSPKKHRRLVEQAEAIIVLDASGGWERVGAVGEVCRTSQAVKVCIDHHPDSVEFADIAIVDTSAAATAELVYDLLKTLEAPITPFIAQALYAAIITDTGNFRFPKTRPQTHQIAAHLIQAGASPSYIYRQIYEQYPLGRVRLKGHLLNSIQLTANGQIAYYSLSRELMKTYGVNASDLDGFAALGQEVQGVRVTVFCVENSRNRVKVSLRSDGSIAINGIAAALEGGGHPSAAGATVNGTLEEVLQDVVSRVKTLLEPPDG
ncbi:MAG: bifunctional oligoribonuclease/PAP phosphatase NrnA [Chloroflexi bacterium]|nr:MAG: bifunctional oligoribonuclease/PAP phosphatase NrnA [Chloroflexota bacterium]